MYRILAADRRSENGAIQRRASPVHQARADGAEPDLVGTSPSCWGRPSGRTSTSTLTRHLQPLRGGWMVADVGRLRNTSTNSSSPRCSPCIRPPLTSKCTAQLLADLGVTRSQTTPPRRIQDPEVPSRLPWPLPRHPPDLPGFFPWYEHPMAGSRCSDDVHHNRTESVLEKRGRTLQIPPGPVIPNASFDASPSPSRLDQPTCDTHNRRNCSVNRQTVSRQVPGRPSRA